MPTALSMGTAASGACCRHMQYHLILGKDKSQKVMEQGITSLRENAFETREQDIK